MLKDILEQKGISAYQLSKGSGVPYTTVNDLMLEKTDLKKTYSETLYRLAKYLGVSMENLYEQSEKETQIYIYNQRRDVHVVCRMESKVNRVQYLGPKNLVSFHRINKVKNDVVYVDTYFMNEDGVIYTEEDYIDLRDLFDEYGMEEILGEAYHIQLGKMKLSDKDRLLNEAILVSDNMAIMYHDDNAVPDICVEIVNLSRKNNKMLLRLKDFQVLSTNMSEGMKKRAIEAAKRNIVLIQNEVAERRAYA